MWNKLPIKNNNYFISFLFDEICVTDFVKIWYKKFTKDEFSINAKESNPHLENISEPDLLEKVTELLRLKTDKIECDIVPENDFNHIKLNLRAITQFGYPIKLKLELSKGCEKLKVTAPLFSVVKDLAASQSELFSIMAKKDKEIEEYKLEGGHLCRKYLKTPAFQECDHLSKHTTMSCVIGSLDVADYVLEKSANSSFCEQQENNVQVNMKSEMNDSNTMQEEVDIKLEPLSPIVFQDVLGSKEDSSETSMDPIESRSQIIRSEFGPQRKKRKAFFNFGSRSDSDSNEEEEITLHEPSTPDESMDNLPSKSRKQYEKQYRLFMDWKKSNNITSFSEEVLLAYFKELATKFKSTSLWVCYSMVKSTLNIKHQIDISNYSELTAYLRSKSEGYKAKRSKTFTTEEIKKFINEAPDEIYFSLKIALIIGISGACRRNELKNLMFKDVHVYKSKIVVKMATKSNKHRIFTVSGKYSELCKQYIKLRPSDCTNPAFFLKYIRGKCFQQGIGINAFGGMCKTIAEYLKLPNPELYTGHCFRRTADTLSIDTSEDITPMRQLRLDIE